MIGNQLKRRLSLVAAVAAGFATALVVTPARRPATTTTTGTTIGTRTGAFGPMLDVSSGQYAGYTVYLLAGRLPPTYGCTTTPVSLLGMPLTCTGPSNDQAAEWPAVTTTGPPVAGPGVSQKLLGTVQTRRYRRAGDLRRRWRLLFETSPDQITGEGWDEPGLPPWNGLWYLLSPTGQPLAWPGTLTTLKVHNKTVLGALEITLAGWEVFPLYSYSGDTFSEEHLHRQLLRCFLATRAQFGTSSAVELFVRHRTSERLTGAVGTSRSPTRASRCISTQRRT